MPTIFDSPPALSLSHMPFIVVVQTTLEANEPLQKIVSEISGSGYSEWLMLNGQATVRFELSEYFHPNLMAQLKMLGPHVQAKAVKEVAIDFYDYYGNPPALQGNATLERTILLGKIPRWVQMAFAPDENTFLDRLATNIFLTWYDKDLVKIVLPNQPELIHFVAMASGDYALHVAVDYTDGTTASFIHAGTIEGANLYDHLSFPVGPAQLLTGNVDPNKKVDTYTVKVNNSLTQKRTYKIDYMPYAYVRFLIFENSLGGFDTLPCRGTALSHTTVEKLTANQVFDVWNPWRFNKRDYSINENQRMKVNSGWLSAFEKMWLNELLITRQAYEMHNNLLRPIRMVNTSIDTSHLIYEPGNIDFEYEYLHYNY